MNRRRREIVAMYYEQLKDIPQVELPTRDDARHRSSWHIFHIKCDDRNRLASHLGEKGITTGVHYKPIHFYSCCGNRPSLPVAEKAFERILSLPLHPGLSDADVGMVCKTIRSFYKR